MMTKLKSAALLAIAWSTALLAATAAPVEFTIDPAQSKVTLSGTVLGNPLREQGPGSLVTSFSGSILAEVSESGIQFTGGSFLDAKTNGVWRPGPGGISGSAPADYAAEATTILGSVRGALRNLVLDLTSGLLPIQNGNFDASQLRFSFPTNSTASFDYDAGFLGSDGIALSGISTNKIVQGATLTTTGDSQTLAIKIDTEFKFTAVLPDDSKVQLVGMLVATSASGPVITSIQVRNGSVVLHVSGAGENPRLDSSPDLAQWTTRTPEKTTDSTGTVLTLPTGGPHEFYRVAK